MLRFPALRGVQLFLFVGVLVGPMLAGVSPYSVPDQNCTATSSAINNGFWNDPAIWLLSSVPLDSYCVVISDGVDVTINADLITTISTASYVSWELKPSATLTVSAAWQLALQGGAVMEFILHEGASLLWESVSNDAFILMDEYSTLEVSVVDTFPATITLNPLPDNQVPTLIMGQSAEFGIYLGNSNSAVRLGGTSWQLTNEASINVEGRASSLRLGQSVSAPDAQLRDSNLYVSLDDGDIILEGEGLGRLHNSTVEVTTAGTLTVKENSFFSKTSLTTVKMEALEVQVEVNNVPVELHETSIAIASAGDLVFSGPAAIANLNRTTLDLIASATVDLTNALINLEHSEVYLTCPSANLDLTVDDCLDTEFRIDADALSLAVAGVGMRSNNRVYVTAATGPVTIGNFRSTTGTEVYIWCPTGAVTIKDFDATTALTLEIDAQSLSLTGEGVSNSNDIYLEVHLSGAMALNTAGLLNIQNGSVLVEAQQLTYGTGQNGFVQCTDLFVELDLTATSAGDVRGEGLVGCDLAVRALVTTSLGFHMPSCEHTDVTITLSTSSGELSPFSMTDSKNCDLYVSAHAFTPSNGVVRSSDFYGQFELSKFFGTGVAFSDLTLSEVIVTADLFTTNGAMFENSRGCTFEFFADVIRLTTGDCFYNASDWTEVTMVGDIVEIGGIDWDVDSLELIIAASTSVDWTVGMDLSNVIDLSNMEVSVTTSTFSVGTSSLHCDECGFYVEVDSMDVTADTTLSNCTIVWDTATSFHGQAPNTHVSDADVTLIHAGQAMYDEPVSFEACSVNLTVTECVLDVARVLKIGDSDGEVNLVSSEYHAPITGAVGEDGRRLYLVEGSYTLNIIDTNMNDGTVSVKDSELDIILDGSSTWDVSAPQLSLLSVELGSAVTLDLRGTVLGTFRVGVAENHITTVNITVQKEAEVSLSGISTSFYGTTDEIAVSIHNYGLARRGAASTLTYSLELYEQFCSGVFSLDASIDPITVPIVLLAGAVSIDYPFPPIDGVFVGIFQDSSLTASFGDARVRSSGWTQLYTSGSFPIVLGSERSSLLDAQLPLCSQCGDDIVDSNTLPVETCDNGVENSAIGECTPDCVLAFCGDGYVRTSLETCDDGNTDTGDGCSTTCQTEPGYSCPNTSGIGGPCTLISSVVCGDLIVSIPFESCDDGNTDTGDGCSATCQTEPGYTCPPTGGPCTLISSVVCGDLLVSIPFESCDDGNTDTGDGCSATCQVEPGNWICPTAGGIGGPCILDRCPTDPLKTEPGLCGCNRPESDNLIDSDSDGTFDCEDGCSNDPLKTSPGVCGCGQPDTDSDSDGVPNCEDVCPNDSTKQYSIGLCGCGTSDLDTDGDGYGDYCGDQCYLSPFKVTPGVCGCERFDSDFDSDGILDCNDPCPYTFGTVCGNNTNIVIIPPDVTADSSSSSLSAEPDKELLTEVQLSERPQLTTVVSVLDGSANSGNDSLVLPGREVDRIVVLSGPLEEITPDDKVVLALDFDEVTWLLTQRQLNGNVVNLNHSAFVYLRPETGLPPTVIRVLYYVFGASTVHEQHGTRARLRRGDSKMGIEIERWPFSSEENRLRLRLNYSTSETLIANLDQDPCDSTDVDEDQVQDLVGTPVVNATNFVNVTLNSRSGVSYSVGFATVSENDGVLKDINYTVFSNGSATVIFESFERLIGYDPSLSALFGVDDECGDDILLRYILPASFFAGAVVVSVLFLLLVMLNPFVKRFVFGKEGFRVEQLRRQQGELAKNSRLSSTV